MASRMSGRGDICGRCACQECVLRKSGAEIFKADYEPEIIVICTDASILVIFGRSMGAQVSYPDVPIYLQEGSLGEKAGD